MNHHHHYHEDHDDIDQVNIAAAASEERFVGYADDDEDAPTALLTSDYKFRPFPATEVELGKALAQLLSDMKSSAGEETLQRVTRNLPVNVRRLLREAYQL